MGEIKDENLLTRIGNWIANNTKPQIYWDYRDEISDETVAEAIEKSPEFPMQHVYETIDISDARYEAELDAIKEGIEHFKAEVMSALGISEDDFDAKEIARDNRETLVDYTTVDECWDDVLRGNVQVRVEMFSNYDCINSHWLESQSPYNMDSYFGDVVRMLEFNPAEVKKFLLSKGMRVSGHWPNVKSANALITLDDFWTEETNRCCGANLLTFVGQVSKKEILCRNVNEGKITIPAGNTCGFYSSCQGGGSTIEAKLKRDFEIDLAKNYDGHGLGFKMFVDVRGYNGYTINEAYGVTTAFWGKNILIHEQNQTANV